MSKSVPIPFPNRHFQQVPGGTISLQETSERQMAQAMPQAAETGQGCTSYKHQYGNLQLQQCYFVLSKGYIQFWWK